MRKAGKSEEKKSKDSISAVVILLVTEGGLSGAPTAPWLVHPLSKGGAFYTLLPASLCWRGASKDVAAVRH